MSNPFAAFCSDFYVNMRLGSQLNLPHQRETLIHFFERIQKSFPTLTRFKKGENGEFNLEESRDSHSYRWAGIETKRVTSGHVNPESIEESLKLHSLMLQLAPYHLGVSPIEVEYLDLLMGFDLCFSGNHDEVIADSLFAESPLACLTEESGAKAVDFQPSITVSLSDDCRLQARIDIITRTNSYQVRTGEYKDDCISVYLILRRYWGDHPKEPMEELLAQMAERGERLCNQYVIPRVLRPISSVIASRS